MVAGSKVSDDVMDRIIVMNVIVPGIVEENMKKFQILMLTVHLLSVDFPLDSLSVFSLKKMRSTDKQ